MWGAVLSIGNLTTCHVVVTIKPVNIVYIKTPKTFWSVSILLKISRTFRLHLLVMPILININLLQEEEEKKKVDKVIALLSASTPHPPYT